ncbi:hypothetical protein ACP26L_27515 [Paenibacillus sp. S-38]|uniref:hypothetical protein n=1 Tax=Paenibacillus sp. S-38 TaxID=3416710 RepID=UPI003CF2AF62
MNPYNHLYLKKILGLAFHGDTTSQKMIHSIKEPFSVSTDFSSLVVVIRDRSVENHVEDFGNNLCLSRYRAEIYRCKENAVGPQDVLISWTYIPIPLDFQVAKIQYHKNRFCFISTDNEHVSGTLDKIISSMLNSVLHSNNVTEVEIGKAFISIEN